MSIPTPLSLRRRSSPPLSTSATTTPSTSLSTTATPLTPKFAHSSSFSSSFGLSSSPILAIRPGLREEGKGAPRAEVPMTPLAPHVLLPMVDRRGEMCSLMRHEKNLGFFTSMRNRVGEEKYKELRRLWIETERSPVPSPSPSPSLPGGGEGERRVVVSDCEMIKMTRDALKADHPDLWCSWCDIVGWSGTEHEILQAQQCSSSYDSTPTDEGGAGGAGAGGMLVGSAGKTGWAWMRDEGGRGMMDYSPEPQLSPGDVRSTPGSVGYVDAYAGGGGLGLSGLERPRSGRMESDELDVLREEDES
ncbi:hypothetical protein YB2330_005645 [Saitoella coloradoensis]